MSTNAISFKELEKEQNGYGGKVSVEYANNIAILTMDRGENRMNMQFLDQMNAALDEIIKKPSVKALITMGRGKFYSNGLDLNWIQKVAEHASGHLDEFFEKWHGLQHRILTFPMPTIAALNGHTFAGGGVMSLVHDYRIMSSDRGWWCMNEVELGLSFPVWILKLMRAKLNGSMTLADAVVYGKRFTAAEAKEAGIIRAYYPGNEILPKAQELIGTLVKSDGFSREHVGETKKELYSDLVAAMDTASHSNVSKYSKL